jgi:hypothetical protein
MMVVRLEAVARLIWVWQATNAPLPDKEAYCHSKEGIVNLGSCPAGS